MSHTNVISIFFSMFLYQVPGLLVCTVAMVVIFMNWKRSGPASLLALLGFGLIMFVSIFSPVVNTAIQYWIINNLEHANSAGRTWIYPVVGVISTVMHAVALLMLLAAIYSGRKKVNEDLVTG